MCLRVFHLHIHLAASPSTHTFEKCCQVAPLWHFTLGPFLPHELSAAQAFQALLSTRCS